MAAAAIDFRWRPRSRTTAIIFHDSHTPFDLKSSTTAYLRARGRTMGLLEVGYHYVIERDGRVVSARDHGAVGAHCLGHNHYSIGICLAGGCCEVDDLTEDQMASAHSLVGYLQSLYGGGLKVLGHSEVLKGPRRSDVQCPAFDMQQFRKDHMTALDTSHGFPLEHAKTPASMSQQNRIVLEQLQAGRSLTTLIAMVSLGISSLSSRIAELRAAGHKIKGVEAVDMNKRRYLKYTIEKEAE